MRLGFVLKLVFTAIALAVIAHEFNSAALARLSAASLPLLLAAAACLLAALSVNAMRWRAILAEAGAPVTFAAALRLVLIGHFFNQTLPSSIGGDAVRAWHIWRGGTRMTTALASVLADRVSGVFGLTVISALALATTGGAEDPRLLAVVAVAAGASLCGCAGLVGVRLAPRRWLTRLRLERLGDASDLLVRVLFTTRVAPALQLASLAIALLSCLTVWAIARALDLALPPGAVFLAVPVALLATAVPLTIGGWGIREGAMVLLLGLYGVSSTAALSISVLLGLLTALCGIPGGILWLAGGRETPGSLAAAGKTS